MSSKVRSPTTRSDTRAHPARHSGICPQEPGSFNGVAHALHAGASGALLKNIDNDELVRALERVNDGETVISPEINQLLRSDPPTPDLSKRQQEILDLLVKGRTNGEIADILSLQEDSIKKVVNAIFEKIGARNRAEAVAIALRKHLLKT